MKVVICDKTKIISFAVISFALKNNLLDKYMGIAIFDLITFNNEFLDVEAISESIIEENANLDWWNIINDEFSQILDNFYIIGDKFVKIGGIR
jgi:hypothetical protein